MPMTPVLRYGADGAVVVLDDPTAVRMFVAGLATGATTGKYQTLRYISGAGGANYVVPANKTLFIFGAMVSGGAGGGLAEVGYGDAAVDNSAARPAGASSTMVGLPQNASVPTWIPLAVIVVAGKYPYATDSAANCAMLFFGYVY